MNPAPGILSKGGTSNKYSFFSLVSLILLLLNSCSQESIEGGGSCNDGKRCIYYSGSSYEYIKQSTKCTDEFTGSQCSKDGAVGFCVKDGGTAAETRVTYYSAFVGDPQTECLGDGGTFSVP